MKNLTKLYFVIAVLSLTACSYEDMADRFVPNEESRFSRDYLQRLQEKDLEYVRAYLVPEVADQVTDEKLLNVAGYFPSGERLSTDLIGSHVTLTDSQWRGNFSFEYRFTGGWALANVVVKKTDGVLAVLGFNVYRTQASRQEINRFTLGGRSALQYTVLTLSIAAPLFVLVTAYFCLRAPIPKRKWLWVLFVLVGVGSVSVNWTTGQLAVQPLSIKLLSASAFSAGPFAPWIVSVSVPLGAVLFWFRRKGFLAHSGIGRAVDPDASFPSALARTARCVSSRGHPS